MKLILASSKDPAARNIAERLLEFFDFEKSTDLDNLYVSTDTLLAIVDGESTKLTRPPVNADELIVASRHVSESGKPSLTAHIPGELERQELALASPSAIKSALKELLVARDELGLPHEVSLEATHHGPTELEIPVTFVEIGSTPEQWTNERAGEAVARAIMKAATTQAKCTNAVGLGGPHYSPRHTEIVLNTDIGIGHILPKYTKFDEKLVELAINRTRGGAQLLVLDWKSMNQEQRNICQKVANRLGIRAKRSKEIISRKKL